MNAKEANQFPIGSYLGYLGHKPSKNLGSYSLYLSPYRNENTASFKVNHTKNLWVDYGDSNCGGTLIDLVLKLNPSYDISQALQEISTVSGQSSSFQQQPISQEENKQENDRKIEIVKVKPLGNNQALTDYLNSRNIGLDTAKKFCMEVYYSIGDKKYFGLGNRNENGWSIRNKYWKGCSAQGYSFYPNGARQLALFEGIFDLMSYVELNQNEEVKKDFLVLNSLGNLNNAFSIIEKYNQVNLYLDRDDAGRKATQLLSDTFHHCKDLSSIILPYTDLNEYLVEETYRLKR
jgi:hypothetical protein